METRFDNFAFRRVGPMLTLPFAFAACLLGGCAALQPVTRPPPLQPEAVKIEVAPLDYYAWARTATENELLVELYGLELTMAATDPVIAAVRKSIILSSSELADAETQLQAAALLEEIAGQETTADMSRAYRIFGEVLLSMQQQREDLRAAANMNQRALREIDALKSRNSELQQQIEEITSIERQLIERERQNTQEP